MDRSNVALLYVKYKAWAIRGNRVEWSDTVWLSAVIWYEGILAHNLLLEV